MAWRVASVENPARLSLKDGQLIVNQGDEIVSLPLEDISTIVLGNSQVAISGPVLQSLSRSGTALIMCDNKFTPCGIYLPFLQHFRGTEIIRRQIESSAPFQKRCWQLVIEAKIQNQAQCLELLGKGSSDRLRALARVVNSGDKDNIEAQAARTYWTSIFARPFRRGADTTTNAALNYGYAIVRAAIARALVGRGLLPALGIHHCAKLNQFNLADDFIEPFRPFVDYAVHGLFLDSARQFDTSTRRQLVAVLLSNIRIAGEIYSISKATELVAGGFVDALESAEPRKLLFPEFIQ